MGGEGWSLSSWGLRLEVTWQTCVSEAKLAGKGRDPLRLACWGQLHHPGGPCSAHKEGVAPGRGQAWARVSKQ